MIADDTVEVADFDGLLGLIDRMCAPVVNPRMTPKRWQTVIAFLEEMERRIFAEERSPDGQPWPDLHPMTVRQKGHAIKLVESFLLQDSMINSGGIHAIRETEVGSLFFGTDREFAGSHQFGAGNIPQREFAGLSQEDVERVTELVADAAVKMMFEIR